MKGSLCLVTILFVVIASALRSDAKNAIQKTYATETCFTTGVCIDLTQFQTNITDRIAFWAELELSYGNYLNESLQEFNTKVPKSQQGDLDIFGVYLYTGSIYYNVNYNLRNPPVVTQWYYTTLAIASGTTWMPHSI
jgi:hypothetical protein